MVKASLNDYRQSPRKVRLVANLVKGKNAEKALVLLTYTPKDAAEPIKKLIASALANAKNTTSISLSDFIIKDVQVNPGVTMKRSMPRAHGRAYPIKKRTSHITMVLDVKKEKVTKATK